MRTNNNKTSISMKNLFIFIFLCLSFLTNAAIKGERTLTDQLEKNDQVIHIQEVYKTVDTFKLKIDIFYTNQSFERENNTAIVFFHGGGWAFGLALCTAMIDDYSEKSDNLSISCRPDAILLFSACIMKYLRLQIIFSENIISWINTSSTLIILKTGRLYLNTY
jgi:hypothetical protein